MRASVQEVMSKAFSNYGISVEHDDMVPQNWNYFIVTNSKYPGKAIRVYAGAEFHDNLTNRKIRNVDAIVCFRSEELELTGTPINAALINFANIDKSRYLYFKNYLEKVANVANEINSRLAA